MITCLITLSLEKEIIVLEKSLKTVLNFGSKISVGTLMLVVKALMVGFEGKDYF